MKIIITESQHKKLLKEAKKEANFKPAAFFDKKYGTSFYQEYDLSPYTADGVWGELHKCLDNINWAKDETFENCPHCVEFNKMLQIVPRAFPYVDYKKIGKDVVIDIMAGMASGFNKHDIIAFSVDGIKYYMNVEQKKLEEKLPEEVKRDIQWVLSPDSINKMKVRFDILD